VDSSIPGYTVGTWVADPIHSEIGFSVRHMMVSNVRGRFGEFEATITTAPNPLDSTATATIQLGSVATGNDKRDEDLRSGGFLNVEKYPTMTFSSTGVRADGDTFLLDGDLTIHDVTKAVTLRVEPNGFGPDPFGSTRAGFTATTEINRSDFGITGNMVIEGGGVVIADKVKIQIELEAVLQKD
jgi:polyisoprenoid-binding protein YceI